MAKEEHIVKTSKVVDIMNGEILALVQFNRLGEYVDVRIDICYPEQDDIDEDTKGTDLTFSHLMI